MTDTMGRKLICLVMASFSQPLSTTRVNTDREAKAMNTNMPVKMNKRLLGKSRKEKEKNIKVVPFKAVENIEGSEGADDLSAGGDPGGVGGWEW